MRKPRLLAVVTFLKTYGLPAMLTFDRDPRLSWAVPVGVIFPPPCGAFCSVWALSLRSVRHGVQTKTPLSNATTAVTIRNAYRSLDQAPMPGGA